MPTLRRWIEAEQGRLAQTGKQPLNVCFQMFSAAFFKADYQRSLDALPELRALAEAYHEPSWLALADYYDASASMYWLGDLNRGRSAAMRGLVRAHGHSRLDAIPTLYAHEMAFYAWLETDGPGYAAQVLSGLDEIDRGGMPADLLARFELVAAQALAAQGQGLRARSQALAALPALDWPEADQTAMQANTLMWAGRWEEAARLYRQAARGYHQDGQTIAWQAARLGEAEALLRAARTGDAQAVLSGAWPSIERGINRAHRGAFHALRAQAALAEGCCEEASQAFEAALEHLDGLGWLRMEAEIALNSLEALRQQGVLHGSPAWTKASRQAGGRAAACKSGDLWHRYEMLTLHG